MDNPLNYNDLFLDVAPDRTALHEIDVLPPLHANSTSGEMRASYRSTSGARVDQWAVMVRGRVVDRAFGGDSVTDLGRVSIDDFSPLPQPPLVFTATSADQVRQFGLGIEYDARWPERGSLGLGLQHVDYRRTIDAPGLPSATDRATPLLPAFRFTINPARQYLIYGSYTRGLEDSQLAPASAVNRGESPPATTTWQIDAGMGYSPRPGTQLLLGAFEVHKGYFSLDSSDVYTQLGQIRHRGIEASATLDSSQGLVAVLGGVWLQAKLLNTAADAATPGDTPLGTVPLQLNADLDYAPAWLQPWGLSCGWQGVSSRPATNDGRVQLPAYSVLSFTVRYEFPLFGHPAVARIDAQNVGNANGMMLDDSGTVLSERERGFMLTLTADF